MKLLLTALFALFVSTSCATELDLADEDHGLMSCPLPEGSIYSYPIANGEGGYVYVNIWYEHCEAGGWDGTVRLKWVRVIRPDGTVAGSDIYIEDCRTCGIPMLE